MWGWEFWSEPWKLWWVGTELNRRHVPFQGTALPTELPTPSTQCCEESIGLLKNRKDSKPYELV